jgi:hypothetical protein
MFFHNWPNWETKETKYPAVIGEYLWKGIVEETYQERTCPDCGLYQKRIVERKMWHEGKNRDISLEDITNKN